MNGCVILLLAACKYDAAYAWCNNALRQCLALGSDGDPHIWIKRIFIYVYRRRCLLNVIGRAALVNLLKPRPTFLKRLFCLRSSDLRIMRNIELEKFILTGIVTFRFILHSLSSKLRFIRNILWAREKKSMHNRI